MKPLIVISGYYFLQHRGAMRQITASQQPKNKGIPILNFPANGLMIFEASENLIGGNNANPGGPCTGDCNLLSGNSAGVVCIARSMIADSSSSFTIIQKWGRDNG